MKLKWEHKSVKRRLKNKRELEIGLKYTLRTHTQTHTHAHTQKNGYFSATMNKAPLRSHSNLEHA